MLGFLGGNAPPYRCVYAAWLLVLALTMWPSQRNGGEAARGGRGNFSKVALGCAEIWVWWFPNLDYLSIQNRSSTLADVLLMAERWGAVIGPEPLLMAQVRC